MGADNQDQQNNADNQDQQQQQQQNQQQDKGFTWKGELASDLANSPLIQKFADTKEGLNEAVKSHASLEQLLGHEKVPIPKGANDTEGWNRFAKALGIPDRADQYGLPDAEIPASMQGMTFDKGKFAEVVHGFKLTPDQAKGLWGAYTNMVKEVYGKAMKDHETKLTEIKNGLLGEWGDAYETKVELGQLVINKFAGDQEAENYLTSLLTKDPRAIKFLAKIGEQFAENKVGEFQYRKFSLSPEEARQEIDKMTHDMNGPYMNQEGKFTEDEHQAAVDRYNMLLRVASKA